jgi:hypothetical protein
MSILGNNAEATLKSEGVLTQPRKESRLGTNADRSVSSPHFRAKPWHKLDNRSFVKVGNSLVRKQQYDVKIWFSVKLRGDIISVKAATLQPRTFPYRLQSKNDNVSLGYMTSFCIRLQLFRVRSREIVNSLNVTRHTSDRSLAVATHWSRPTVRHSRHRPTGPRGHRVRAWSTGDH